MRQGLAAPERLRKTTATKHGLTLAEYDAKLEAGEQWCTGCKEWHHESAFFRSARWCKDVDNEARLKRRNREWEEFRNWLLARVLVK